MGAALGDSEGPGEDGEGPEEDGEGPEEGDKVRGKAGATMLRRALSYARWCACGALGPGACVCVGCSRKATGARVTRLRVRGLLAQGRRWQSRGPEPTCEASDSASELASIVTPRVGRLRMRAARAPNSSDERLSAKSLAATEMVTSNEVRALPPRLSASSRVSVELRYGTCRGARACVHPL